MALLGTGPSAAADAVQNWTASHRKAVDAYQNSDYNGAVAQTIGPDPQASAAQFTLVESNLREQSSAPTPPWRDHVSAAGKWLAWSPTGTLVASGDRWRRRSRRDPAATQGVPVRARIVVAVLALTLAAGCGSPTTSPSAVTVAPVDARPAGAQEVTTVPDRGDAECTDPEASLRPARNRSRAPCLRVRRWRRSSSADG